VLIAHLTATFPPYLGGAGTTTLHLARGLAARGHDVEVLTAQGGSGPEPDTGGARVRRLPVLASIGNAPLLPGLLRAGGHDVVHLHHPFLLGTELTLLRRLRARGQALVVSYHNRLVGSGGRAPLFRGWELTWGRWLLRAADRVCVLSEAHARSVPQLAALERRSPERIAVLPNGVDLDLFRPGPDEAGVRATHGIPEGAVVAAFVATLDRAHYFKRLDRAIDALRRAGGERLHLLVVGAGEELEAHRRAAAAAGLTDRVHFAGAAGHDRLPALLRAADLLLLSSDPPESFGIVLIEAMASGLPTISTDLPGVSSVGVPGQTGLVAPREDPDALAAALRTMADLDPEGRRRMGRAGRAHAEAHYAWPRLVERTEAIYAGAIGERSRRRRSRRTYGGSPEH
jgi:glycosyltransferase involved in cell wall biosynthesis